MLKFSIVTISYNQSKFLKDCIDSIIFQDYDNIEYIIVDAGSIDGSRDLIRSYGDKLYTIFEHDSGPADGLNKGFSKATGDILGFINSDDILLPEALKFVSDYFTNNPDIDVVYGHSLIIDQNGTIIRKGYSDRFSMGLIAYNSCVIMQPSTFFRSSVFRKTNGFNVNNKTNWDGELFIDMYIAGAKFIHVNKFLSCYRLHPTSITSSRILDKGIHDYQNRMFRKIIGRNRTAIDQIKFYFYRLLKHIKSPIALYERIVKGPIYGRF